MNLRHLFLLCLLVTNVLHSEEWWVEGGYLLWTTKKAPLSVPLVTSASLNDPVPGALGQPGTKVLMGNKKIDMNWRNGFRVALGGWIGSCQQMGLEGSFFMLPKKSHHQSIHTSGEVGSLNLAAPIYDVTGLWGLNGVPGETVFILPGPLFGPGFKGRFSLKISSKLLGSDVNASVNLISSCGFKMDFIGGLRWVQLEESLSFIGKTAALPNAPPSVIGFYNFKDSFKTNNNFWGPQVGLKADYNADRWLLKGFFKVALGCMNQKAKIQGKSQTSNGNLFYMTQNTGSEILTGGVFTEPSNHGTHHRNAFAIAIETGANLSYKFSDCFEIGLGYNFLWLTQVFRPGNQIDRKINPSQTVLAEASRDSVGIGPETPIPFGTPAAAPLPTGPKKPKFKPRSTDFWAQGLTVTLNLKF